MRRIGQARVNRNVDLKACGLERRYRLPHVSFVAFVHGARELFGGLRHTPRPNPARRANHCVCGSRDSNKIADGDAIEDRGVLADKNSQEIPFERAITECHPLKVRFIDDAV